jgi:hypothetical protein
MTAAGFATAFEAAAAQRRRRSPHTPTGIASAWEQLVEMVEAGYEDNVYEYDNDLAIRDLIEELLHLPALAEYPEFGWFRDRVAALDDRMRSGLSAEPVRLPGGHWWRSHLPVRGGPELADDLKRAYGYQVPQVLLLICAQGVPGDTAKSVER